MSRRKHSFDNTVTMKGPRLLPHNEARKCRDRLEREETLLQASKLEDGEFCPRRQPLFWRLQAQGFYGGLWGGLSGGHQGSYSILVA